VVDPQADISKETVQAFCNHFAKLKAHHHTFMVLFSDKRLQNLMIQTAKEFFLELNEIMLEHFFLNLPN
jgi:hypothetical protein